MDLKSIKGFSLIEVLVVLAVVMISAAAISSLMISQQRSIAFIEDKFETLQISQLVKVLLETGLACQNSLQGIVVPSPGGVRNVTSIMDINGNPTITSNSQVNFINIGQIVIRNETVSGPSSSGVVEIEIPFTRSRTGGGPSTLKPYKSKIPVNVGAASEIVNCSFSNDSFNYSTGFFSGRISVTPPTGFVASECQLTVTARDVGWAGQTRHGGHMITYGSNLSATCQFRDRYIMHDGSCQYQLLCSK